MRRSPCNQAGLDTAKINLGFTPIEAPMDGTGRSPCRADGDRAQQAPNILTLADLGTMLVKAQVSEADVINLKPGQGLVHGAGRSRLGASTAC